MDGNRFDELSRVVAGAASRRGVLRGIAAGMIAGIASGTRLRGADARRSLRGTGELCRKPGECESNVCVTDATGRGRCGCPSGSSVCNGSCCQTFCHPEFGCVDSFVNVQCFDDCEQAVCFGVNNSFNYTFNSGYPCEQFCAEQCSIG